MYVGADQSTSERSSGTETVFLGSGPVYVRAEQWDWTSERWSGPVYVRAERRDWTSLRESGAVYVGVNQSILEITSPHGSELVYMGVDQFIGE